jgi:hypothetical protein
MAGTQLTHKMLQRLNVRPINDGQRLEGVEMSTWQVALVREQGIEFAVVSVQDHVVDTSSEREDLIQWWQGQLGRPVVLIGARRHRTFGRRDLAQFVANVGPSRLPWRQMSVAA